MSTFAVLLLCIQACLVQNVFGQCLPRAGLIPAAPIALSGYGGIQSPLSSAAILSPVANAFSPAAAIGSAAAVIDSAAGIGSAGYGGIGEGNVAVIGELPVSGNTALAGQVPIIGIVSFGGAVPAAGAVSINGQSACIC